MLISDERRLHYHQCGGVGRRRRRGVLAAGPASMSAVSTSRSLLALKVTRKYRQAAVRRREYRRLKAIVPAVSAKHTVSKKRSYKQRRALHQDSRRASSRFIRDFNRHLRQWNVEWKHLSPDQKAAYRPTCLKPRTTAVKPSNCYVYFVREKIEEGLLTEAANFGEAMRMLSRQWHNLPDDQWQKYRCKNPRRNSPSSSHQ